MLYEVLQWGQDVGEGVNRARYCTLGGVAKGRTARHAYVVVNEVMCMRLALALGLPVPPGVVTVGDDGAPYYVSLRFGPTGSKPPPAIPADVVQDHPYMASGIIVFDSWVVNADRHARNLAYARDRIPLAIFDHSHALLGGGPAGTGADRFRRRRDRANLDAHCLVPALAEGGHLTSWCDRVAWMPDRLVREICRDAARDAHLDRDEAEKTADFLLDRKKRLKELLASVREQFANLHEWSLL